MTTRGLESGSMTLNLAESSKHVISPDSLGSRQNIAISQDTAVTKKKSLWQKFLWGND